MTYASFSFLFADDFLRWRRQKRMHPPANSEVEGARYAWCVFAPCRFARARLPQLFHNLLRPRGGQAVAAISLVPCAYGL